MSVSGAFSGFSKGIENFLQKCIINKNILKDTHMNGKQNIYELIEKYKPDNYTTCTPEDAGRIVGSINDGIARGDLSLIEYMQRVDFEKYPVNQTFDLHTHYENMYKEFGQKNFPAYKNKKIGYSHNIKNVYNRNRCIENEDGLKRINSIFEKISNPQKGLPNKALMELSEKFNIVFQIIEGRNFDGECRYQKAYPDDTEKSVIISITQGALSANDDALAVLLGHELSHGIDISRMPNNYIGTIGWEAPEDFANIMGANIAQNAGYDPTEFIKAQGRNNDRTQRAADMLHKYVIKETIDKQPNKTSAVNRVQQLRGIFSSGKAPYKASTTVKPNTLHLYQSKKQND